MPQFLRPYFLLHGKQLHGVSENRPHLSLFLLNDSVKNKSINNPDQFLHNDFEPVQHT